MFPADADAARRSWTVRIADRGQRGALFFAVGRDCEVGVGRVPEYRRGFRRVGLAAFRFRISGLKQFHRITQELFLGGLASVLGAEEAFVRGVLEEAAHKVSHAGQQGADGAILTDAVPALDEGRLEFVRHAIERLELVRAGINLAAFGLDDGVGA